MTGRGGRNPTLYRAPASQTGHGKNQSCNCGLAGRVFPWKSLHLSPREGFESRSSQIQPELVHPKSTTAPHFRRDRLTTEYKIVKVQDGTWRARKIIIATLFCTFSFSAGAAELAVRQQLMGETALRDGSEMPLA